MDIKVINYIIKANTSIKIIDPPKDYELNPKQHFEPYKYLVTLSRQVASFFWRLSGENVPSKLKLQSNCTDRLNRDATRPIIMCSCVGQAAAKHR